ncbi:MULTISPECIES: PaaI family thioesterase [Pandoraea]|uniref:Esterase HI_1161 n=2 Tax=Pandoraea TaxID=93217 RepID=A0A378YJX6_9BURK|nr:MULTISPECIES: PaaI family thioesterase [Pandoraea]AHB04928.1 thioesterase [Pandoraea pnomenusa 3kgm]AHB74701.1 thioesterase [Pandoraea pnomenusa]AHN76955.1 thioesterase [Pandoraea pnomenusa]AIU26502.1 thioesterase [Pandoraea pnomenusa]ANC43729.1 thioesterase [Pandoraea pnomenusa]
MSDSAPPLPVLTYLQRQLAGTLRDGERTHMRYPTPISELLQFQIVEVGEASAVIALQARAERHGNQQGTVHGGLLCELADAAIGTAHSTLMAEGESFTSIDLKATFLRPVWNARLLAHAYATHRGRTVSHYQCDIRREDGKAVARIDSAVMTLRGEHARGR